MLAKLLPNIGSEIKNIDEFVIEKYELSSEEFTCNDQLKCHTNLEFCNTTINKCECIKGFKRHLGTKKCVDINECIDFANEICKFPNSHCENILGAYNCRCNYGYFGDGINCIKEKNDTILNEQDVKGYSKSIYLNKVKCPNGYFINPLTNRCEDIDECEVYKNRICNYKNSQCQNVPGTYICICKHGFVGNGIDCTPAYLLNFLKQENNNVLNKNVIKKCSNPDDNICDQETEICVEDCGVLKCICKKGYIRENKLCIIPPIKVKLNTKCTENNITMYIPYKDIPNKGFIFVEGMAGKRECSTYYNLDNIKTEESSIEKAIYFDFSFLVNDCISHLNSLQNDNQRKLLGNVIVHDYNILKNFKNTKFEIECTNEKLL
uniref:EGF-like domain-containing protein n=1 Tax=Parastrongyloides trichosuri TaxID=131310 RepID=A0A0N4ZRE1_PARTI